MILFQMTIVECSGDKHKQPIIATGNSIIRSPSLGACNYPVFLSRRFHRPNYFYFKYISNSDPHRNLNDQLQLHKRTNVDVYMSACLREVALF